MKKEERIGLRTWIEIDTNAIKNNVKVFRKAIGDKTKLMAVVKSNAYGHDLIPFAEQLEKDDVDWIGVDSIVEALTLRKEGVQLPILVLGHTLPEYLPQALRHNISITVSSVDVLRELDRMKGRGKLKIHLKIDTGMHRQGFRLEEQEEVLKRLVKLEKRISLEGVYTHFAAAKDPAFPGITKSQVKEFEAWVETLESAGFQPITHASATAGALLFSWAHFDMVRVGIGMYGLWPSKETQQYGKAIYPLVPVLSWKAVIGEVKYLEKGDKTGYDHTEGVSKRTKIAVVPVGYWHGLPRALSGVGKVLVGGVPAKILGRVSMDMIVIDVSQVSKVRTGDEVVLIGAEGKRCISADDMAILANTINYEIVTRLNPRIKRLYI